ncbi:MAG: GTPase, partial [Nostoc sp.]
MSFQKNINSFQAAEIAKRFKKLTEKFDKLLEQVNTPEISSIHSKLHQELKQYYEQGFLTVAFVGQYSAGKSTMMSALTGRRDIHIGADITTDKTTSYDWNGIQLIDTPGLFTDRKDHDEITYEAIR